MPLLSEWNPKVIKNYKFPVRGLWLEFRTSEQQALEIAIGYFGNNRHITELVMFQ